MTDTQKLEAIKAEIERRIKLCGQYQELSARKAELECIEIYILTLLDEQSEDCDTCTNDKGCVACENGELYEGKRTDYTKSNEEKAKEIAENNSLYVNSDDLSKTDECYIAAMEMAKWKDEQFQEEKNDLRSLVDMLPMNDTNQTIIEDLKALLR